VFTEDREPETGLNLKLKTLSCCNRLVAQAFQPVQTEAKACGYKKYRFDRNSVSKPKT
jgi:hypothetical protein